MLLQKLFHSTHSLYKYSCILHHYNRSFASQASPLQRYHLLTKSFTLKHDEKQEKVVTKLDELYDKIQHYTPPKLPNEPDTESSQSMGTFDISSSTASNTKPSSSSSSSSVFKRFFGGNDNKNKNIDNRNSKPSPSNISASRTTQINPVGITMNNVNVPNGLYIYGSTGTGKTMLMDLFYESITNHSKQRVHFNKFMLEIHASIHEYTQKLKESGLSAQEMRDYDAIPSLSLSIARESTILCFDEFQVTDIVDAVLLNRLFTSLFYYGIICIVTSNREPNMLYLNGLQRQQVFVPFLKLFKQKMDIIDLNSIDYRDHGSNLKNIYYSPSKDEIIEYQYEESWDRMIEEYEGEGGKEYNKIIDVMGGRHLNCPRSIGYSKATRFTFNELCSTNLGSADYLALSKSFSTIFIDNIPYFNYLNRNEMKRFILLIDELYNSKNRMVCLAVDAPDKLLNIDKNNNIFEDIFQFDRCSSRLMEMQSIEYLNDFKNYWRDQESEYVD